MKENLAPHYGNSNSKISRFLTCDTFEINKWYDKYTIFKIFNLILPVCPCRCLEDIQNPHTVAKYPTYHTWNTIKCQANSDNPVTSRVTLEVAEFSQKLERFPGVCRSSQRFARIPKDLQGFRRMYRGFQV